MQRCIDCNGSRSSGFCRSAPVAAGSLAGELSSDLFLQCKPSCAGQQLYDIDAGPHADSRCFSLGKASVAANLPAAHGQCATDQTDKLISNGRNQASLPLCSSALFCVLHLCFSCASATLASPSSRRAIACCFRAARNMSCGRRISTSLCGRGCGTLSSSPRSSDVCSLPWSVPATDLQIPPSQAHLKHARH